MPTRRYKLIYPPSLVDEPILYQLIRKFGLITSIQKADISPDGGWLVLDLRGDDREIDQALTWLKELGLQVQPQT